MTTQRRGTSARAAGTSMQLTRAADYAVRAMIFLAGLPPGRRCWLADLSRAVAAPPSFLSKVLQKLCRAGLIVSRRGQTGGFTILPAGRQATIAVLMEVIEGPLRLNACIGPGASCSRRAFCPAHPLWVRAQSAVLEILNSATVAELANPVSQLNTGAHSLR